jgi:hypothetical protein
MWAAGGAVKVRADHHPRQESRWSGADHLSSQGWLSYAPQQVLLYAGDTYFVPA